MKGRAGFIALTVGALIGLSLGLVYTWLIDPVELYNTTPGLLRADYRYDWVRLVALGYLVDGDLQRAQARLAELPETQVQDALAALIEAYAAQGRPAETMRTLSELARQLGIHTPAMLVYLETSAGATPTDIASSPAPTFSPTPPPAPTATATSAFALLPVSFPYRVLSQTLICSPTVPQLQVWVRTAPQVVAEVESDEEPEVRPPAALPGVTLWLQWPGGADRAVTGLRPQIDPGYADFVLQPDVPYALSVREPNAPIFSGLMVKTCPGEDDATPYPGTWQIVIEIGEQE